MGLRGPRPKRQISTIWSSNLAYVIGLIATDGCLYNDGRHISFVSADLYLVTLFGRLLGLKNKIGYKSSGSSKIRCPHLQFGDINFYQWLVGIGLTPRKSKTLGPIDIPRKYFLDFVRGCFDGDGSFYSYMDPRWKNSHMFYASFASGSRTFIEWLRSQLQHHIGIVGYVTHQKQKDVYQLRYAKAESLVLIRKMYYSTRVPCLERKRRKIRGVLKKHYEIQFKNPRVFLPKGVELNI